MFFLNILSPTAGSGPSACERNIHSSLISLHARRLMGAVCMQCMWHGWIIQGIQGGSHNVGAIAKRRLHFNSGLHTPCSYSREKTYVGRNVHWIGLSDFRLLSAFSAESMLRCATLLLLWPLPRAIESSLTSRHLQTLLQHVFSRIYGSCQGEKGTIWMIRWEKMAFRGVCCKPAADPLLTGRKYYFHMCPVSLLVYAPLAEVRRRAIKMVKAFFHNQHVSFSSAPIFILIHMGEISLCCLWTGAQY